MKYRSGFVSNSSSSSYLIYGFFAEEFPEDIGELFDIKKGDWKSELNNYVYGYDCDIIGEVLASWEDGAEIVDRIDTSAVHLEMIRSELKDIIKDQLGFEVPDDWFKLIGTTYHD